MGIAVGIVDFIRRVPFSLKKYRLYLPQDVMAKVIHKLSKIFKHNINVRNLWERIEGKPKDELFDVILEVAAYARLHLYEAKKYSKNLPQHAFRAFLHGVIQNYIRWKLNIIWNN